MTTPTELRRCFVEGLPPPDETAAELQHILPGQTYVPPAHKRALSPDTPLVVGGRGAGKSFWHRSLMDDERRALVATAFDLKELRRYSVTAGFGADSGGNSFPDRRALRQLLAEGHRPDDIWTAVILRAVAAPGSVPHDSWVASAAFVASRGEEVDRLLREADERLVREGRGHLLVFDALDKLAPDSWDDTQDLLRGLLMVALEMRGKRALRLKIFARGDMIERGRATSFPDASKIVGNPVELEWSRADLYGLLWQYLGNGLAPSGEAFRNFAVGMGSLAWSEVDGAFPVPPPLRSDESMQESLFHRLAGRHMGSNAKRGNTYHWLANHLADENRFASPRSFLIALHVAAEETPAGCAFPLDWRAIREGVRRASHQRAAEVEHDLPWVEKAMRPLKGLNVPCRLGDIEKRWRADRVMEHIGDDKSSLSPPRFDRSSPQTLLHALVAQGICRQMQDGRINIPDIYRVTYGLGRRGGVPVKR